MIKNYLLLFVRNLGRQRLFSAINLLGLTVSIASTIVIGLYVQHEFSYDNFHPHSERLYRVNQTFIWAEDETNQFSRTGPGVANALKEELPEVELITSLHTPGDFIISYENPAHEIVAFQENKVLAADTNFFKVFNFPLVYGDLVSAFSQANTLVMTRDAAERYFGEQNPVGKLVRLGGLNGTEQETYEVTGVVENLPSNNTLEFDVLLSMKGFPLERLYHSWIWTQLETFVLLREDANVAHVREKLVEIPRKRADESLREAMNMSFDEYIKSGKKWELFLQPITSMHLPEEVVTGSFPDTGNIKIIYAFIGAGIFIILLSCVNFMNLSTAQFSKRIKEASVRKILGLGRKELSVSYFLEAFAFCVAALIVALALVQILLPAFNMISGKHLTLSIANGSLICGIAALVLFMAIISSSYPALFLTTFHPVNGLRGKARVGQGGAMFRNGLVIFQFAVSIILIVCTAVVFQQLKYASEKDLGFDRENLLVVHHAEAVRNSDDLVQAALTVPGASKASWCSSVPPTIWGGDSFSADEMNDVTFPLNFTATDENFIPALGINLILGRNFQPGSSADSTRVILNESAVRKIGWKMDESLLGKRLRYPNGGSPNSGDPVTFEVIGVVSDFNYWTIETTIEPMGIFHNRNKFIGDHKKRFLVIKVAAQNSVQWSATFAALEKVWREYAGDTPFEYSFVDQNFARTFVTQQRFGNILVAMAVVAILIAGLGLLGMIIYSLEQRTKEIGIRKVSGASAYQIVVLISRGYTKLIVLAFLIGAPISWWVMKIWLEDFAYAITPSPWIFACTGFGTLLLAVLITGYHSVKAAMTNPVDVLKDE
jgi:putative ABC transport system permease protein